MLYQYINNSISILTDENLVERISMVLTAHFSILNKKGYYAKNELLKCLLILIMKVKKHYSLFANDTLKKILMFINQNKDLNLEPKMKKNLLDIIYNLIYFNKEEIQDYIDDIIYYVKLEKVDKNKDVRMIALNILNLLNEEVINYDKNNLASSFNESKKNQDEFINLIKNDKLKKGKKEFILVEKKLKNDNLIDEETKNDNINNNNFNLKMQNNIIKNFNGISEEMNNIEKRNEDLFSTVGNLQNYLNYNYEIIDNKLDRLRQNGLKNIKEESKNINLNNEIKALLLKDDNLIDYLSNISDELIEKISSENIEDIIRRLILFYSINKDNQKNLYKNIMQKMINKKQSSLSKTFLSITKNLISN
jgi:hypothetical protein